MRAALLAVALLLAACPALADAVRRADVAKVGEAVVAQTNAYRAKQKLGMLQVESRLANAAKGFARYMATTGRYGHEVDGRDPPARAKVHGYDYCVVLENIAYHYDSRGFETARLAHDVVEGWKGSPPHRKNMLNPDVAEIGVGVARSEATGYYYTVQMFGLPRSASVKFEVRNESRGDVRYRVGGEGHTVPARSSRTHEVCTREALEFDSPPGSFRPKGGERFVIPPSGDRVGTHPGVRPRVRR